MTDNLLDQENTTITPPKDFLSELVGEGKKFRDSESLAEGKWQSDQYIKTLEGQLDRMREDFTKVLDESKARAKLEDLVNQIQNQNQQAASRDTTQNTNAESQRPAQIDLKQIESLVSNKVQELELTKRQTENFNMVRDKLIEKFGSNYQTTLKKHVDDLGLTETEVNEIARRSPKLFLKTFDLEAPIHNESFQAPPQTQHRSSFAPKTQKRDWQFYEDLRKNSPKQYYDNKTQVQMNRDIIELTPETFYNDANWISKT